MPKFLTLLLFSTVLFAQQNQKISGKIIDSKTQIEIANAVIAIQNSNITVFSNTEGFFTIENVSLGDYVLKISSNGYENQLITISINENDDLNIGVVVLEEFSSQEKQLNLIAIADDDLNDDDNNSENISSLLQANRDAFLQAVAFNFGQARFNIRGIDSKYTSVMINGIVMNKFSTGRPQYSNWGGLNDATRNQEFTNGSALNNYNFSSIGGSLEINTKAAGYKKGSRISYTNTNSSFTHRPAVIYASGMNHKGWAFVISGSQRAAQEAYFPGTNFTASSVFVGVEKKINAHHSIHFTGIFASNKQGKVASKTREISNLLGANYNSFWGFQSGEIRNSRIRHVQEPLFILNHYWKLNSKNEISTAVSYQLGKIGNSRIDYAFADNPDPSYPNQLKSENDVLANPQINWDNLYRINQENSSTGSRYVLYEDRNNDKIINISSLLNSQLTDAISLNAGVGFIKSKSENYKNLLDLLGGAFYKDINIYGLLQGQNQNDLNNPDRKVFVGDKYGYHYFMNSSKLDVFSQFKFTYPKIDFYLSQSFSKSSYQREGIYRNGYFPENSLGLSAAKNFDNFGFKTGATYKISGKKYIDFNGLYQSRSPLNSSVFTNSRISNEPNSFALSEIIKSVDLSYILKTPVLKARCTAYFNQIENETQVSYFFADGLQDGDSFVTQTLQGINRRNMGVEIGIEYQINSTLRTTFAAGLGNYFYSNNPNLLITNSENGLVVDYGAAHLKNYKIGGSPQQVGSVGLEYKAPKFWFIGANANYLGNNFVSVAPILRTENFISSSDDINFPYDKSLADSYLNQEKLQSYFLINLLGGKTWRIKSKMLGFFASINNVTNTTYETLGFEQSRKATFSELYQDYQQRNRSFGPKYFYGLGRTFLATIYLKF
jgi:hypothetical protein